MWQCGHPVGITDPSTGFEFSFVEQGRFSAPGGGSSSECTTDGATTGFASQDSAEEVAAGAAVEAGEFGTTAGRKSGKPSGR